MTIGHNLYSSSSWHDSCRSSSITEFTMILVILVHHGCVFFPGVIKQNVPQRKLSRPIGHPQTVRAPKYWSWYPMVSFYHHRKEFIFCGGAYTQACPQVDTRAQAFPQVHVLKLSPIRYMYSNALPAGLLFLAILVYFPSSPPLPPRCWLCNCIYAWSSKSATIDFRWLWSSTRFISNDGNFQPLFHCGETWFHCWIQGGALLIYIFIIPFIFYLVV